IHIMVKNAVSEIEKALKQRKKPVELLNLIFAFLNFKKAEVKIYNLLLKKSLTIKEMEKQLGISERTIRKYLKKLHEEGFIQRKVDESERLRYIYRAVSLREAWKLVRKRIENIMDEISQVIAKSFN
ncbi:MAG: HTH domain-containing protein, partial [Thermoplasmata archaeon]|nr:HTH domain-containing protein [Thermoplasmata archaeon]